MDAECTVVQWPASTYWLFIGEFNAAFSLFDGVCKEAIAGIFGVPGLFKLERRFKTVDVFKARSDITNKRAYREEEEPERFVSRGELQPTENSLED